MSAVDDLEFHVLACLAQASESRRYGWQIQYWLEEQLGLTVRVTSVYRVLSRFHAEGWVDRRESEQHPQTPGLARKYYTLNTAGWAHLRTQAERMLRRTERLGKSAREGLRALSAHEERQRDHGGQQDVG